jgi:hypothetical protein
MLNLGSNYGILYYTVWYIITKIYMGHIKHGGLQVENHWINVA